MLTGWIQPADVARSMGVTPHAQHDLDRLSLICAGLNQAVADWRPDLPIPTIDTDDPSYSPVFDTGAPATDTNLRITLGLIKLAKEWYTGMTSNGSAEAYDGLGGIPLLMTRELESLLEVGRFFRPVTA